MSYSLYNNETLIAMHKEFLSELILIENELILRGVDVSNIPQANVVLDECRRMLFTESDRVGAIRYYRDQMGVGLKEAADVIDRLIQVRKIGL